MSKKRPTSFPVEKHCNLCSNTFPAQTIFDRFCSHCKEQSELWKFSEWLPEFHETLALKNSA